MNKIKIAPHTSGIILEIPDVEILNKYVRLAYESPIASNLNVTHSLISTEIACLISVSTFSILVVKISD